MLVPVRFISRAVFNYCHLSILRYFACENNNARADPLSVFDTTGRKLTPLRGSWSLANGGRKD